MYKKPLHGSDHASCKSVAGDAVDIRAVYAGVLVSWACVKVINGIVDIVTGPPAGRIPVYWGR